MEPRIGSTESRQKIREVEIPIDEKNSIKAYLCVPQGAKGIVLFVHGSGSSRFSSRNRYVAGVLNESCLATLLIDLLTANEEVVDLQTRELRFDINLLTERVMEATRWLAMDKELSGLKIGYFGASTGAAAALSAAAELGERIGAVVSRGGRPDLAGEKLSLVKTPTLLIVGGDDELVIEMNKHSAERLNCKKEIVIVPGATHLFEEPGKLERVAEVATEWFVRYIGS